MSKNEDLTTPVEIDTKIAELYYADQKLGSRRLSHVHTALEMAGAKYYYRGRKRVTDMTLTEAITKLSATPDHRNLMWSKTHREALKEIEQIDAEIKANDDEIKALQDRYTGWNRFFVVTSSNGHIHSSMECHTCRWTTTYGWLPNLSGKSEAEAIKHFGPAAECLCSVCFPDAPVATKDQNLTQKQTDALLAGKTPEAQVKKQYCPGSGEPSATQIDWRLYYKSGTCPHCGYVGGITQGGRMRKHQEKK